MLRRSGAFTSRLSLHPHYHHPDCRSPWLLALTLLLLRFPNNLTLVIPSNSSTMNSPTPADRARKMELRQEAAAVAAATAAAAAIVSQEDNNDKEDGSARTQDAANVMMVLAAGASPTTPVGVTESPSTASPSMPTGRVKGKGRALHLGPTIGIEKSRRPVAASPVGISSAGSSATASPAAVRLAPSPPTYPPAGSPALEQVANPYAWLVRASLLYPATASPRVRAPPRRAPPFGASDVLPRPSQGPTAPVSPLGTKTATVFGFVMQTVPTVRQTTGITHPVPRHNGTITSASPMVSGIRRRGHRISAACLARQLERAGAKAAAKRLTNAASVDGAGPGPPATPRTPAAGTGLFTRLNSSAAPVGASGGATAPATARMEKSEDAEGPRIVIDVGTGAGDNASADIDNGGAGEIPFLGAAARAGAADGAVSPAATVARSLGG